MHAGSDDDSGTTTPDRHHWASRAEDRVQNFRERRARQRGHRPTIVPFTGYGGPGWIRVLGRVVLAPPVANRGQRYKTVRGWRSFVSVPLDSIEVTVTAGTTQVTVTADRGGVVDADVPSDLTPGWHTISLQADGAEEVTAPVFVARPQEHLGIVSDVDDTVMVTALPRPFLAAWNTFVLDEHARRPVAGMAVLYERLARRYPGAPVVYVSTGAWNVAPTLTRFLSRNLYPPGALLLTDWGPTHDRWFRSGRDHKRQSLERLAREFPGAKWILIGDDGQHDEDIYGEFAKRHPQQVAAVAIRQLSTSEAVLAGGRSKARDRGDETKVPWVYAPDGAGLAEQLADLGLLDEGASAADPGDVPGMDPEED